MAQLGVAEPVGTEEGHEDAGARVVGVGVQARKYRAQPVPFAHLAGVKGGFLVARQGRADAAAGVGVAGVAGGVKQRAPDKAVAAVETGVGPRAVGGRGQGQRVCDRAPGDIFEVGVQVQDLLGRELVGVAHVMLDADYGGGADALVRAGLFGVLAPPGLAVRRIEEAVPGAQVAVVERVFVKMGVAVGARQAVRAQGRRIEQFEAGSGVAVHFHLRRRRQRRQHAGGGHEQGAPRRE